MRWKMSIQRIYSSNSIKSIYFRGVINSSIHYTSKYYKTYKEIILQLLRTNFIFYLSVYLVIITIYTLFLSLTSDNKWRRTIFITIKILEILFESKTWYIIKPIHKLKWPSLRPVIPIVASWNHQRLDFSPLLLGITVIVALPLVIPSTSSNLMFSKQSHCGSTNAFLAPIPLIFVSF